LGKSWRWTEEDRSRLKGERIDAFERIEPFANEISKALVSEMELEDARLTLRYVVVELLRKFELPVGGVVDYPALIETIKERAKQRTPQRAIHRWIRFEPAPPEATTFEIQKQAENTPAAIQLAQHEITPRILRREPIVLDFAGLRILTQSYLHSLLFEPLRLAWALRIPIYVKNVEPAVRSNLELLENYALAG
jgi:hypothetical protein